MSTNVGVNQGIANPALHNDVEEEEVEVEEEEEMVEEEVTDDEQEAGESEEGTSTVNVESPSASPKKQFSSGSTAKPGKVSPSKEVKNMAMKSPAGPGKASGAALNPDKNPFPSFGDWTPTTMSQIEISFPILTGKNESTNELTRSTRPEARYWKAPIVFKFGNFTSETLRFDNVHIPFHTGKGYGSSYVYLCLPGFAADAFAEAGKRRAPTKVGENSLVPDSVRWWKIANKVENVFGIIDGDTKKFHTKNLETIFDSTQSGISCSVILNFKCKAATDEKEPLRATTVRTISVEVVRGYVNDVDVNVQMPTRVSREKKKVDPVASVKDVATDSLRKRLAELGL